MPFEDFIDRYNQWENLMRCLPETVDGRPIVPGISVFDENGDPRRVLSINDGSQPSQVYCDAPFDKLYSTRDAALNARGSRIVEVVE